MVAAWAAVVCTRGLFGQELALPQADVRQNATSVRPFSERMALLEQSNRIVFLGDSITYAGDYVAVFESWILTQGLNSVPLVINVGLSSETVSGLSEAGHAGGRFPRPNVAERLDRVLAITQPDLVFACYGINCGIYQPFDTQRFREYQQGIENLNTQVEATGAKLVLITPPVFDDRRSENEFSYDAVLTRYSEWLTSKRDAGWIVIDLHGPMSAELVRRREIDPAFTFQPDAVHPNADGHWFIASQLIRWFGDDAAANAKSPTKMLAASGVPKVVVPIVQRRMALIRDAYLTAAGHQRPGVKTGLPIADAQQQASQLTNEIQGLIRTNR